jgi:hypothetical protein
MTVQPAVVMAGLVPAIHAAPLQRTIVVGVLSTAWMPGTRPGMTRGGCSDVRRHNQFPFPGRPCRERERALLPHDLLSQLSVRAGQPVFFST